MDGDEHRGPAGTAAQGIGKRSLVPWQVYLFSGAGLVSILTGLAALALPAGQEGALVWQLSPQQAIYWMDVAGFLTSLLGVVATWMGARLWRRSLSASREMGASTSSASGSPPPAA